MQPNLDLTPKGPSWRPVAANAADREWEEIPSYQLARANYVILVDEFAEISRHGLRVLTREELRKVCNREETKEAIMEALK